MGGAQRGRRWLVPATAVAMVAGVGALGPVVADASPELPAMTAQELLSRVQTARVEGLSGTVRSATDLGLPALPGAGGESAIPELLTGEHTARVAFAKPDQAKVSVLDEMAERVWTIDGDTAWSYDSRKREATRRALPTRPARPEVAPEREAYDPQAVAKRFLAAIDPTTEVEVSGTENVAGRDAYQLRLVPKTDKTTVGSVTLAVDSKNWVPLQVTVMPRTGKDPAAQVGFTAVSFEVPPASTFAFTPPAGTKVTTKEPAVSRLPKTSPPKGERQPEDRPGSERRPEVVGQGWESVAVLRGKMPSGSGPVDQLLAKAPTVRGGWGEGKLLTSRMVSALITTDGRILVGLVPPGVLESAAATAPR